MGLFTLADFMSAPGTRFQYAFGVGAVGGSNIFTWRKTPLSIIYRHVL